MQFQYVYKIIYIYVYAYVQIVFMSAMAGIVATQLDHHSDAPYCYLNVKGQVCVFTYVTTGAAILFALGISIPIVWVSRSRRWAEAPIIGIYFSIALFSLFWQMVMCITIQIRGKQATDAGLPGKSARQAALAFAWLSFTSVLLNCTAILTDL